MAIQTDDRRYFFYGSLREPGLRAAVLGAEVALTPARLPGWRVAARPHDPFPTLVADDRPGAAAEGGVAPPLTAAQQARLAAFEGAGYALTDAAVETPDGPIDAVVFATETPSAPEAPDWSYEEYAQGPGLWAAAAARAQMAIAEVLGVEAADALWPDLAGAAQAALARAGAGGGAPELGSRLGREAVAEASRETVLGGAKRIERVRGRRRRLGGAPGEAPFSSLVLRSGCAATLLPYDPKRDAVLLIEQFRAGAWLSGADRPWTIEAVAGGVDAGEDFETAARREAREEAGVTLGRLIRIATPYTAAAWADERLAVFLGEADLEPWLTRDQLHGLDAEHEDIRAFAIPLDAALEAAARGEIAHPSALIALYWLDPRRSWVAHQWADAAP